MQPITPDQYADHESWEQRRYWHDGALVDVEWWQDGRLSPEDLDLMPSDLQTRDYCYQHRTPIYPDLGCQVCRQRPSRQRGRTAGAR